MACNSKPYHEVVRLVFLERGGFSLLKAPLSPVTPTSADTPRISPVPEVNLTEYFFTVATAVCRRHFHQIWSKFDCMPGRCCTAVKISQIAWRVNDILSDADSV